MYPKICFISYYLYKIISLGCVMKKHFITIITVLLLLGLSVFIGFCALFKPFDRLNDYSGYIYSIETDMSGAVLIQAKMSLTDEETLKLKTVKNVKILYYYGEEVDIEELEPGMLINVDFPIFKHKTDDGEYYLAKKIIIIKK